MVIADFAPCSGALFPMKLSVLAEAAVDVTSRPARTNERKYKNDCMPSCYLEMLALSRGISHCIAFMLLKYRFIKLYFLITS